MNERANPFGDLGDFTPASAKPKTDPAVIDQVAEAHGFPSRQPSAQVSAAPAAAPESAPRKQRRYTTGRTKQINIKATPETVERANRMADERRVPMGVLLEFALQALEEASKK